MTSVTGAGRERSMPTVSVVIPCYNYARFLPDAVSSVLTQQGVEVEVVVVDDASTDASAIVAEALARDPRVRLLRHSKNRGPVAAFNDGLVEASGEFLVRLDADDMLTPGSLARSAAVCHAHPSVGLVYGHPVHFTDRPGRARAKVTGCTVWPGWTWLTARCRSGVNVITSPEAFMRRSVIDRVGGQRDLAHTHDMEMWLRIASVSDVAYIHGADQAWHREHAQSLSQEASSAEGLTILEERRAAFHMLCDGLTDEGPRGQELRRLADRALAKEALARACYEFDRRRATAEGVDTLTAFAVQTSSEARELREWADLKKRKAWGPHWATTHPWHLLRPVRRVVGEGIRSWRWRRTGIYERGLRVDTATAAST